MFKLQQRLTWEQYALLIAKAASYRSEDPYIQVGACALRHDNSLAGTGYNNPPTGISVSWEDREDRRKYIVHAESNCLGYCKPGEIRLLACTLLPCASCMALIGRYQINTVIFGDIYQRDQSAYDIANKFKINLIHLPFSTLPLEITVKNTNLI